MSRSVRDNIGYWLFYTQRCVSHAFGEALKGCCVELGKSYVITPPQWGLLSALYEHDGQTIGEISQDRGIDAPTVTGIVTRLQQHGLVRRVHDKTDRRVVKVYLTQEGRELCIPLNDAVNSFDEIEMNGFSPREQQELLHQLQKIIVNVSAVAPGTGDRFRLLPEQISGSLDQPLHTGEEML